MTTVVNKNEFHAPNAGMEMIRIIATLMLFGGIGVGAWVMSQQGYADKAATVLSAGIVFVLTRLWSRGMIGVPTRATRAPRQANPDEDFLTANARAATNVVVARMNAASVATLSAMGLVYGIAFLVLREAITKGLTFFNNIWICVTFGLIIGSIVAMPGLIKQLITPFRKDQATVAQAAGATVPTPASPVAAPQPPQQPTPKKVVVRRAVNKEEGSDV